MIFPAFLQPSAVLILKMAYGNNLHISKKLAARVTNVLSQLSQLTLAISSLSNGLWPGLPGDPQGPIAFFLIFACSHRSLSFLAANYKAEAAVRLDPLRRLGQARSTLAIQALTQKQVNIRWSADLKHPINHFLSELCHRTTGEYGFIRRQILPIFTI